MQEQKTANKRSFVIIAYKSFSMKHCGPFKYQLTVVVPIYNTAQYLERCVRSLMHQDMDDIQYIFIDDGSTDGSMDIVRKVLDEYPERRASSIIVEHRENKGIGYTRQEGNELAEGEYIIHCDSDDWIDDNLYGEMYRLAKTCDADMVSCGCVFEDNGYKTLFTPVLFDNWQTFYTWPKRLVLCYVLFMVKKSLLIDNHLQFSENINFGEDYNILFKCYYYSRKNVAYLGDKLYHVNRDNLSSLTHHGNTYHNLSSKEHCLVDLIDFIKSKGLEISENKTLIYEERELKECYLLCNPPEYKAWKTCFPAISRLVVRDHNLSVLYRVAWWLGQNIDWRFMATYHYLSKRIKKM